MQLNIKGKKALILGSSGGLGLAIAKDLVQEGARVCLVSRDEERLKSAQRLSGAEAYLTVDLTKKGAGKDVVERAVEKMGGVDILVTNTGGPPTNGFLQLTTEQWEEGFQSLWMSSVEAIKSAIPGMQKAKWGRILLITSTTAKEPLAGFAISSGLRAGLLGLTKSISNEFAPYGITVNAILPGYTRTERLKELGISDEKISAMIPAKRLGEPEELAALVTFLASDKAAYISGQTISVDGGLLHGI